MFNFVQIFPFFLDYGFYAPLFLRLALGIIFLAHGYKKLAHNKSQFIGWLESMNFRPGKFWAWLVTLAEFLGGILLIFGFLTQFVTLILIIEFLIILFYARKGQPFIARSDAPGMSREFDFLIFFALISLLVLGPGAWSIDLPL